MQAVATRMAHSSLAMTPSIQEIRLMARCRLGPVEINDSVDREKECIACKNITLRSVINVLER
jgi:hypothetical protein